MPDGTGQEGPARTRFSHRNRTARGAWVLIVLWWAILLAVTVKVAPSGNPKAMAVLAPFWLAGLGFAAYIFGRPVVSVAVEATGAATIERRFVWGVRRTAYGPGALAPPRLEEERNSDGDPYYRCILAVGRERIAVAEGHDKPRIEQVATDLAVALRVS